MYLLKFTAISGVSVGAILLVIYTWGDQILPKLPKSWQKPFKELLNSIRSGNWLKWAALMVMGVALAAGLVAALPGAIVAAIGAKVFVAVSVVVIAGGAGFLAYRSKKKSTPKCKSGEILPDGSLCIVVKESK